VKSFGIAFFAVFALAASGIAQYKLEYKASGSIPLHYKAHATVEVVQTTMGQEQKINMVMDQYFSMAGKEAGSDELLFSTIIDSGESLVIMPTGDTNRISSPAVGKVKETRIRPNGEQLSSRWVDTVFASSQAAQVRDFGALFFKLPSSRIDTGATWTQDRIDTVGTPGAQGKIVVTTNMNYKLVGRNVIDGVTCARIQFEGKVALKGITSNQGMSFGIDGSGTNDGTALFDYSAGKMMKITGSSNQEIVMASTGENSMTIPVTQKTNYEISYSK